MPQGRAVKVSCEMPGGRLRAGGSRTFLQTEWWVEIICLLLEGVPVLMSNYNHLFTPGCPRHHDPGGSLASC